MEKVNARRLHIVLSAVVYPGAGQLMQGRPAAGIFYIMSFTVFFLTVIVQVVSPIVHNLIAVLDWSAGIDSKIRTINLPVVFVCLAAALAVYTANMVDVVKTERRRRENLRSSILQTSLDQ